jgi:hypothetical protein
VGKTASTLSPAHSRVTTASWPLRNWSKPKTRFNTSRAWAEAAAGAGSPRGVARLAANPAEAPWPVGAARARDSADPRWMTAGVRAGAGLAAEPAVRGALGRATRSCTPSAMYHSPYAQGEARPRQRPGDRRAARCQLGTALIRPRGLHANKNLI